MTRRDFVQTVLGGGSVVAANVAQDQARARADEGNRVLAAARETGRHLLTDNPDYPSVCFRSGGRHWRAEHCLAGWQLVELFDGGEAVRHTDHGGTP